MEINQYDIMLVSLDPTIGCEIKKTRPSVVISPDEMNKHITTVIIAPMTTKSHSYPTRVKTVFQKKTGWIVLDQIRVVDKQRLVKKMGRVEVNTVNRIKAVIKEMLVD